MTEVSRLERPLEQRRTSGGKRAGPVTVITHELHITVSAQWLICFRSQEVGRSRLAVWRNFSWTFPSQTTVRFQGSQVVAGKPTKARSAWGKMHEWHITVSTAQSHNADPIGADDSGAKL